MPTIRLTTVAIERLRAPPRGQVEYFDTHLPSFGLRVSYSGSKAWIVMTRLNGHLVRLTLGRYPELSLADARRKAREAALHAREGRDPRAIDAERHRQRERERLATFEFLASQFLETHVEQRLRRKTRVEYRRILQGRDTHHWRTRPIRTICKDDVKSLLCGIEQRGAPAAANRSLAYLSKFFNWCLEEELINANPATRVRLLKAMQPRERILTDEELGSLCAALDGFPEPFGALFRTLLLTGQRRGEVGGMRWDELRGLECGQAVWELPSLRTKNGQPHLVPLTPQVQAILSGIPRNGPFVFTTTGQSAVSGFSKAKRKLDKYIREIHRSSGSPPFAAWTLHDLRRTMVTLMNERLGIAPHVVEAVVNHTSGAAKRGVAGVYNRALYFEERRRALQAWAALVSDMRTLRPTLVQ